MTLIKNANFSPECFRELNFDNSTFVNIDIFCVGTVAVKADEVIADAIEDVSTEKEEQDTPCVHDVRSLETELRGD